jgi:exosortase/archaeosortase family protein
MAKKKNNKSYTKDLIYIGIRYLLLLLIVFSLPVIYKILLPITLYSLAFLLKIFYTVELNSNFIILNKERFIQIIPACVAGSAYLLLLVLNLSVKLDYKKRLYSIIFSVFALFILNIIRVFTLSILSFKNYFIFETLHLLYWYVLSIFFVIGLWFFCIKIFRIRKIPFYSDIKSILNSRAYFSLK